MIRDGYMLDIAVLACHVITLDVVTKIQSSLVRNHNFRGCADTDLLLSRLFHGCFAENLSVYYCHRCHIIFETAHVNRLQFGHCVMIDV